MCVFLCENSMDKQIWSKFTVLLKFLIFRDSFHRLCFLWVNIIYLIQFWWIFYFWSWCGGQKLLLGDLTNCISFDILSTEISWRGVKALVLSCKSKAKRSRKTEVWRKTVGSSGLKTYGTENDTTKHGAQGTPGLLPIRKQRAYKNNQNQLLQNLESHQKVQEPRDTEGRKQQLYFPKRLLWQVNFPPATHTLQRSCSHRDGRTHSLSKYGPCSQRTAIVRLISRAPSSRTSARAPLYFHSLRDFPGVRKHSRRLLMKVYTSTGEVLATAA